MTTVKWSIVTLRCHQICTIKAMHKLIQFAWHKSHYEVGSCMTLCITWCWVTTITGVTSLVDMSKLTWCIGDNLLVWHNTKQSLTKVGMCCFGLWCEWHQGCSIKDAFLIPISQAIRGIVVLCLTCYTGIRCIFMRKGDVVSVYFLFVIEINLTFVKVRGLE